MNRRPDARPGLRFALSSTLLGCVAWVAPGCRNAPPTVSWRAIDASAEAAADPAMATLWVSYQIAIDAIDGHAASLAAGEPCVYYRVLATPGEHELALRLHYRAPTHVVRSAEPAVLRVRLERGGEYRLLDLAAGTRGARRFTPWLQEGPPPRGAVEPPTPGAAAPGAGTAGAGTPGAAKPGAAKPGEAKPGDAKPGARKPGAGAPRADELEKSKPARKVRHRRAWTRVRSFPPA